MTLWGGRFGDAPGDGMWSFTVDSSDKRLLGDDVDGSLAHAAMLERVGLLTADEAASLDQGLRQIRQEVEAGAFEYQETDEDVHTAVERRLRELVGDVAGKLHTGRSRNDQVTLDLRLYLRRSGRARIDQIDALVSTLAARAGEVADVVVASYTHMQHAQSVSLGHHLLAYAWMLLRDAERFESCLGRVDVSPLGAGASAGSTLPLDPGLVAGELGMSGFFDNSLDAVGSRDFVSEYVFCCAQAMAHLSRFAEELVLWSTSEFAWAAFRDRDTTGSSALPHKKNPDIAELVRGRAATVTGDTAAVLALQKGLPLAYNRDLQEDKRIVFHADDVLAGSLSALNDLVEGASFDPPTPSSWVASLDLAEALVTRGVPFREAHDAVGRLVASLMGESKTLRDAEFADLQAVDDRFEESDLDTIESPLVNRRVPGSGTPQSVLDQITSIGAVLAARAASAS